MLGGILPAPGHIRTLALAQSISAIAGGIYFSSSSLFFVRASGLTPIEIGLGLTIAGVVGLLAPLPFGVLADRIGARGVAVWLMAGVGLSCCGFLFVDTFAAFVVTACCFTGCLRGAMTARMTIIAKLVPLAERSTTSAYLRALGNCGLSVGAMIGGLTLFFDDKAAYQTAFALDGLMFLAAAIAYRSLPPIAPEAHTRHGPRVAVLRDRPFAGLTFLNAIVLLYIPLLNMAVPLWIAFHTAAPVWVSSLLYAVNTISVMTMQVWFARRVQGVDDARRSIFAGTFLLSVACMLFAITAWPQSALLAAAIAIAAALLHAVSEMMHMAGAWELSFRLAPENKQGEYQGFFNMSSAAAEMFGPLLLTALLIDWGTPGWILLTIIFPATGFAMTLLFTKGAVVPTAST